ncbi:MAG: tRNA (adenosine(37)-N6)-threonylcarbamoyltransferase complex dimerization subunit type 1 TsaB [Burkholderiaceae bacterium]
MKAPPVPSDEPVQLAIALPAGQVALALSGHRRGDPCAADAVVLDERADGGMRDGLIEAIGQLLAGSGVERRDLEALVFEAGPGGFSRVRAACAVAQGIGYGLDIPVAAFDSQLLIALCAHGDPGGAEPARVVVVRDARMGEVFVSAFEVRESAWRELCPSVACPFAAVEGWLDALPPWTGNTFLTGDAIEKVATDARAGMRVLPDAPDPVGQALVLSAYARRHGRWSDAIDARPHYLRDKVALDIHEQAALRASRA